MDPRVHIYKFIRVVARRLMKWGHDWVITSHIELQDAVNLSPVSKWNRLSRYEYIYYKDRIVMGPTYLYNGNPYTDKV